MNLNSLCLSLYSNSLLSYLSSCGNSSIKYNYHFTILSLFSIRQTSDRITACKMITIYLYFRSLIRSITVGLTDPSSRHKSVRISTVFNLLGMRYQSPFFNSSVRVTPLSPKSTVPHISSTPIPSP